MDFHNSWGRAFGWTHPIGLREHYQKRIEPSNYLRKGTPGVTPNLTHVFAPRPRYGFQTNPR